MSNIVEKREYVDGGRVLLAQIQDNGCVGFAAKMADETRYMVTAAISSEVLRQLADLADAAKVAT